MNWDSMVMDASSRQSYTRGERLAARGAASGIQCSHESGSPTLRVSGEVADGTSGTYKATAEVDRDKSEVLRHSCTCGGDPDGLCKHEVCLLLNYQDSLARGAAPAAPTVAKAAGQPRPAEAALPTAPTSPAKRPRKPKPDPKPDPTAAFREQTARALESLKANQASTDKSGLAARVGEVRESQTSPHVSNLIFSYSNSSRPFTGIVSGQPGHGGPKELADLEVTIVPKICRSTTIDSTRVAAWEATFKVHSGKVSYAIRRLDEVVGAWERQEAYSYGKELEFVHSHAAFTRRANDALAVIARVLHTQQASRMRQAGYWSNSSEAVSRSLGLGDADVADLLDAFMGARVYYDAGVSETAKPVALDVLQGDPDLPVSLERGLRGGFDLVMPTGAGCVMDDRRMYLLIDGHAWRCTEPFRLRMGNLCKALLPCESPYHIREKDMPGFCAAVLPAIRTYSSFETVENLDDLTPPEAEFSFKVSLRNKTVNCEACVTYAHDELGLFCPPAPKQPLRDMSREDQARELVLEYFAYEEGQLRFAEEDTEALQRLLSEGIPALREIGEVFVSQELRGIHVRRVPNMRVKASLRSGLLDIAVESSDLTPRELQDYLSAYQRRERYVRLADGDIVQLGGGLQALVELAGGLGVQAGDLAKGTTGIPLNRALFVDSILKRSDGVRFDRDEGFRAIIRQFDSIADADFVEPESLRGVLRPYQREGFKWLSTLANLGFGAILADDMGLGKTLQMIAFLLSRHEDGNAKPSLVVCPASLVYNWISELTRFAPQLRCVAVVGPQNIRRHTVDCARGYDVLVTSYELLKRDIDSYTRQHFSCQVLDEAQYIKNAATQSARCAKLVDADVRFALTGTPIENRLTELWSIFDFLMPGLLGSVDDFHERFEDPIALGDEDASLRLQSMAGPFILRRLKSDVLKDLPEKNESVVYTAMNDEQRRLYDAVASNLVKTLRRQMPGDFAQDRFAILAELTKLRQICCDPHILYENYEGESGKLEAALDLVRTAVEGGHKVLLFSQFTSMLSVIGRRLEEEGLKYHELTGSTPKEQRARLVSSFQTDDVPIFLISLKAGGVGLNLTAADIVIHYDPWWNLAAQNQATDRAHRIGQTRSVNVMRLIAKGTIEEKIVALQESKRELAESILGGQAASSASLSKEDILALLD